MFHVHYDCQSQRPPSFFGGGGVCYGSHDVSVGGDGVFEGGELDRLCEILSAAPELLSGFVECNGSFHEEEPAGPEYDPGVSDWNIPEAQTRVPCGKACTKPAPLLEYTHVSVLFYDVS